MGLLGTPPNRSRHIPGLRTGCCLVAFVVLLAGCGQKGPLFIPPEQQSPASAPEAPAASPDPVDDEPEVMERPVRPEGAGSLEEDTRDRPASSAPPAGASD